MGGMEQINNATFSQLSPLDDTLLYLYFSTFSPLDQNFCHIVLKWVHTHTHTHTLIRGRLNLWTKRIASFFLILLY